MEDDEEGEGEGRRAGEVVMDCVSLPALKFGSRVYEGLDAVLHHLMCYHKGSFAVVLGAAIGWGCTQLWNVDLMLCVEKGCLYSESDGEKGALTRCWSQVRSWMRRRIRCEVVRGGMDEVEAVEDKISSLADIIDYRGVYARPLVAAPLRRKF